MNNREQKYWIIVASKDHVKTGIAEGIAQACHGKASPLRRMQPGDKVVYYSSKQTFGKPEKSQEFTAIGEVQGDEIYQVEINENFKPFRRNIDFYKSEDVSILPLIDQLDFIKNKEKWGYPFRYGFFEINAHDYQLIADHMLTNSYA